MSQLERLDLHAAIELRYPDNTTEDITPKRLRDGLHELVDSVFVTATDTGAVPNVPAYVAGTTYAKGFTVRYTPVGGSEGFYYSLNAGKLTAPGPGNLVDWKAVPGPVAPTALWQSITLLQAQGLEGAGVVPGRLYRLDMGLDPQGDQQYVWLMGLEEFFDTARGVLEVGNTRTAIENINLGLGSWTVAGASDNPSPVLVLGTSASDPNQGFATLAAAIAAANGNTILVNSDLIDISPFVYDDGPVLGQGRRLALDATATGVCSVGAGASNLRLEAPSGVSLQLQGRHFHCEYGDFVASNSDLELEYSRVGYATVAAGNAVTLRPGTVVPANFFAAFTRNADGSYTTPQGGTVYDERGQGGSNYTDQQARAAQLNRTPPPGTTTVTLTPEAATDYGTAASGTFTVDATNCVVGKEAYFNIGPGGTAPVFSNAPTGQPYDQTLATFAPGKLNRYALRVFPDRVEVINIAR